MAKAITLDDAVFQSPPKSPRSAPSSTSEAAPPAEVVALTPKKPKKAAKVAIVPLQLRIPAADAKAIKIAAVQADQTISDYVLACVHAKLKA